MEDNILVNPSQEQFLNRTETFLSQVKVTQLLGDW